MTSKGKKSTPAGQKSKARTQEKKNLTDAPVAAGVDKEKMAAFFSTAEEESAASPESPAGPAPAAEKSSAASTPPPAPPAGDGSAPATDEGSFSIIFLFVVLGVIGVSWLYYVNSHSARIRTTSAATLVKSSSAGVVAVAGIEQKIKALEAQIACLQSRLAALEAQSRKAAAPPPAAKKPALKAAPAKDSSFSKAPVPFWRQEGFRHPAGPGKSLIKPAPASKPVAEKASTPAAKPEKPTLKKTPAKVSAGSQDSSFSKAPVPFWRQEKFKSPAARAQAVLEGNAARKAAADKKAPATRTDGSFSKAPKPFWEK
jgi:hypothetical protein